MIDAISTAAYGLRTSANQFEKAAQKVVKATVPEAGDAASTAQASPSGDADLATGIVESKMSALSFKANAAVVKTGDKMLGTLLDAIA